MKNSVHLHATLEEIDKVVDYLGEHTPDDAIIFLTGDLAAGKTTLTSAIARSKGVSTGATSPTFSLQQTYCESLYHYDLYRIDNVEFFDLGLHEELEKSGWHIIEWANEELKSFLANAGYNCIFVTITTLGDSRDYQIEY